MNVSDKLKILAMAAKYDVSCSSSGARRTPTTATGKGRGVTVPGGCCHSWSDDGRCISLLKILFSNLCIYDCAYCANRCSNDIPRATFTVEEIVSLTIEFYRRNYIEGLFLSSGVVRSPDYTMERLGEVCSRLRTAEGFNGYIHLKIIPGASWELIRKVGFLADRVSINIELPSEKSLKLLAPEKQPDGILPPIKRIGTDIDENRIERRKQKRLPVFVPAGQSTQLIIGATPESDFQILRLAQGLYHNANMKRVYYSAYVPVNRNSLLPDLGQPPLRREHRLYQADWLLRFYNFKAQELLDAENPFLDQEVDPKINWALRHLDRFPFEINRAGYNELLRVPGIGIISAKRILTARRWSSLTFEHLKKLGVILKRACYFITCNGKMMTGNLLDFPSELRTRLIYDLSPADWRQPFLFQAPANTLPGRQFKTVETPASDLLLPKPRLTVPDTKEKASRPCRT